MGEVEIKTEDKPAPAKPIRQRNEKGHFLPVANPKKKSPKSRLKTLLLPYQIKWLNQEDRFAIWEKSRQIGASWIEACKAVKDGITNKQNFVYVSHRQEAADGFIEDVISWTKVFDLILKEQIVKSANNSTVELINGARIEALPRTPTALRGMKKCTVCLDEFAHHFQAEELFTAAYAVTTWGGNLHVISTHNGAGTFFNQLIERAKAGKNDFKIYRTTIEDALKDGLALKITGNHKIQYHSKKLTFEEMNKAYVEQIKRNMTDEALFGQEYMCEIYTSSTLINEEDYKKCVLPNFPVSDKLDKTTYGRLYCGIDIGRSKNLTVIWILEEGHDGTAAEQLQRVFRTVAKVELSNMPFQAQYQKIEEIISHPNMVKAFIDQGACGMQLAEDLKSEYGGVIEPISINHTSKARMVERMKKFVSQQRMALPDDSECMADITAMKRITTKTGLMTYDGSHKESHCDRFMACALALEASEQPVMRLV